VLASQLEQGSADGVLLLHEKLFRIMEMKKERVLALKAESRGIAAELQGVGDRDWPPTKKRIHARRKKK
jgi:hypothetical protein